MASGFTPGGGGGPTGGTPGGMRCSKRSPSYETLNPKSHVSWWISSWLTSFSVGEPVAVRVHESSPDSGTWYRCQALLYITVGWKSYVFCGSYVYVPAGLRSTITGCFPWNPPS